MADQKYKYNKIALTHAMKETKDGWCAKCFH